MEYEKTAHVDVLDYLTGPIETRMGGKHKRGVFATRYISKGELLLVEKSFFTQTYRKLSEAENQDDIIMAKKQDLMKLARTALIKKMRSNKKYIWQAMNLYRGESDNL